MGKEGRRRKSKDRKLDREKRILEEFIEERGWERKYRFTGRRGNTVIDCHWGYRDQG